MKIYDSNGSNAARMSAARDGLTERNHDSIESYIVHQNGQLNISELARVCDISRTTAYKYIGLLEA